MLVVDGEPCEARVARSAAPGSRIYRPPPAGRPPPRLMAPGLGPEQIADLLARRHHGGGVQPAGGPGEPLDRPGDREGSQNPTARPARAPPPPAPGAPRTGAEMAATPASRSAALAAEPRPRTPASVVAVNLAP